MKKNCGPRVGVEIFEETGRRTADGEPLPFPQRFLIHES
jgi:hypothetical protein